MVQGGISECGEPRCAEGLRRRPGVPWRAQKRGSCRWLGPGNTNVARRWVGTGIAPSQYPPSTHPPSTPPCTHPCTPLPGPPVLQCGLDGTVILESTKEILGVDNALVPLGSPRPPYASCSRSRGLFLSPPVGPGLAVVGLRSVRDCTAQIYCRFYI